MYLIQYIKHKVTVRATSSRVQSGMMRMVKTGDHWEIRNTRTRDVGLFRKIGFEPQKAFYPEGTS